jgi:polyisoprenoid-binding protein YceI
MKSLLICLVFLSALQAGAAEYTIDARGAHAAINFKYKHIGISWLTGTFKTFSGTFSYDEENPASTRVVVDIDPASLDSNHAERDKHIKGKDYLNVAEFPTARFESTRVEPKGDGAATVFGSLTLHGVTREIAITAEMTGQGKDPWGGYRVGFAGTTTIRTEDFGFRMPPSNEVLMELFLEGVRQ